MSVWASRQDLKGLFDPTVDAIVNLVKAQVDAVVGARNWLPKIIILVGGFSGNPYLISKLHQEIEEWNRHYNARGVEGRIRLQRIKGDDRILSVSRGCALYALRLHSADRSGGVISRVSQASYTVALRGGIRPAVQLITKGEDLPVDSPRRVRVDTASIGLHELEEGRNIGLVVHRQSESGVHPREGTITEKYCEIQWNEEGATALRDAMRDRRPVELGVALSAGRVLFDVYIGGVLQQRERDVLVRYE
ncbi:hypothetical protein C8A01DRAFT_34880 [Parachaetomium inaequale]|uniref:Uncharacterized protein n=1 Tax=Parachaetomium inaequale TaxID=2588326 RepID=A0AAN6PI33_9PEZI|nr:hypothetical protein C8A01DRAFT_34880 [Parachaetomium inaequale]